VGVEGVTRSVTVADGIAASYCRLMKLTLIDLEVLCETSFIFSSNSNSNFFFCCCFSLSHLSQRVLGVFI